ncbi:MAG: Rha family transcriptional regulator [Prevotella sp.]|nr:Rha family transcriptional regulator [Alistipes senegalensis]MCM1357088.1 Rha family transcriptional regulator [Prevotella sp.]MCM1472590.1 Rha family transcriptional regulator [Muribaculaceae bacterium]
MKELIPKDKFGIFVDNKETARVDSLFVAKFFGKSHNHVVRDIEKLLALDSGLSKEFNVSNFGRITYKDSRGRTQKAYALTRDGFTILTMGYTGAKAMHFKELYIKRFNEMESFIRTLVTTRKEFPLLTENIKLLHENPKPYHFSNECDMINKLVTGMTAKKFREVHGVPKGESIRPYLTDEQLELMEKLQKCDVGLLVAFPDYEQRKRHLEWYMSQIQRKSSVNTADAIRKGASL